MVPLGSGEDLLQVTAHGRIAKEIIVLPLISSCSDYLVADSACSATAYMTGIKGRKDTLGLTEEVEYEDCEGQLEPAHHRHASLLYHAQEAGLGTGLVTTDRLTGASPAGGLNIGIM